MSILGTAVTAATLVGRSLRRAVADPKGSGASARFGDRAAAYDMLWSYYQNNPYDALADPRVTRFLADYGLYRFTRPVYNPAGRIARWWVGAVYGGPWSEDGQPLPGDLTPAIPFAKDAPAALVAAASRGLTWGNWAIAKGLYVKYGSMLGDAFAEVVDDLDRGKVYPRLVWPGHVADLELDASGNVKEYEVAFRAEDKDGKAYGYRKRVDRDAIRVWHDDRVVSEERNPYGFAPAVWVKHEDDGDDHGTGALAQMLPKLDELNSLAAHIGDEIHKQINAVKTFATDAKMDDIRLALDTKRDGIPFMKVPKDTLIGDLTGGLNLADALAWVAATYEELERDHPELRFYQQMREADYASGPGIAGLLGDVEPRYHDACAAYDLGTVKLCQMLAAIGGHRATRGDWGPRSALSRHQRVFLGFGLDSYARGDLDLAIVPRRLVTMSDRERWEVAQLKKTALGLSDQRSQIEAGYDPAVVADMAAEKAERAASFGAGLGRMLDAGETGGDERGDTA